MAMRCIRSSNHRSGTNLPFERAPRRGGGQVQWRTVGTVAALGAVLVAGVSLMADRDAAEPVQVAQASRTR